MSVMRSTQNRPQQTCGDSYKTRDCECADAPSLSVTRRISSDSTRGVTRFGLSGWFVCGMFVRSSDSDTLLLANEFNGLQQLHLRSLEMQLLCGNEMDEETGREWRVVNVTEVDQQSDGLLLLEFEGV